ncbi:hypothetical protein ACI6QG_11670 [Roseococcus sp. DSY-14]|uniref:hypothetical protein n=1 Tax=Roseococcus sp. DSY-14 TaxID=3369650 RepID=UPI00387B9A92
MLLRDTCARREAFCGTFRGFRAAGRPALKDFIASLPLAGCRFLDLGEEGPGLGALALAAGAQEAAAWPGPAGPGVAALAADPRGGPAEWDVVHDGGAFSPEAGALAREALVGAAPASGLEAALRRHPALPAWTAGWSRADAPPCAALAARRAWGRSIGLRLGVAADPAACPRLDVAASPAIAALLCADRAAAPALEALREAVAAAGGGRFALLPALRRAAARLEDAAGPAEGFGSARYWMLLLKGLVRHVEWGGMEEDNLYLAFLRDASARGAYDPGMAAELRGPGAAARIEGRLERVLDILCTARLAHPAVLFDPVPGGAFRTRGGGGWDAAMLDGNHRLAALWLAGAAEAPFVAVWQGEGMEGSPALLGAMAAMTAGG